jgi:hypothetical protein
VRLAVPWLRSSSIVIRSLDETPAEFESEDAEREYWWTHEFSDELWESLPKVEPNFESLELTKREPKVQVHSWDDARDFASEDEERDWWENR